MSLTRKELETITKVVDTLQTSVETTLVNQKELFDKFNEINKLDFTGAIKNETAIPNTDEKYFAEIKKMCEQNSKNNDVLLIKTNEVVELLNSMMGEKNKSLNISKIIRKED